MEHKVTRMLRIREVCQRTGLSRSQIYRLIDQSNFPAPIPLGPRSAAWVEIEVENWLQDLIARCRAEAQLRGVGERPELVGDAR